MATDCDVQVFDAGYAVIGDEVLPVTSWIDGDGDDCEAPDAVVYVAGPDAHGFWVTIDLGTAPNRGRVQ